jgi:uncharacterized membrane protein
MNLSPEERKKIYEEEKNRLEKEGKAKKTKDNPGGSSTSLKPNTASMLCYLGFWVTGIVFLIIEKKNKLVRYHAMHSLVTFGILNIIWGIASSAGGWGWGLWGLRWGFMNPVIIAATVIFTVAFILWWVLWGVALYKSYHGTPFRYGSFSDLAEKCLAKLDANK